MFPCLPQLPGYHKLSKIALIAYDH